MAGPRYIERHAYFNSFNPMSTRPYEEQMECIHCGLPKASEAHYVIETIEDYQKRMTGPTQYRYDPTSLQRAFDLLRVHLKMSPIEGGPCANPAHVVDLLNEAGFDLVRKQ